MRNVIYSIALTILLILTFSEIHSSTSKIPEKKQTSTSENFPQAEQEIKNLYQSLNASSYNLNYDAFRYAMLGYNRMKEQGTLKNDKILTIIDFTKESKDKRFYTIDLENKKFLYNTFVSHGRNSGNNKSSKFSDTPESHQSSIGFYTTGNTYIGKHGKSLRLHGNEIGYNSNAFKRAVVIHGAKYVSESFIKHNGRLGRSFGCPALPMGLHKEIIKVIKNGSLIFAYYNDAKYLKTSQILKGIKTKKY